MYGSMVVWYHGIMVIRHGKFHGRFTVHGSLAWKGNGNGNGSGREEGRGKREARREMWTGIPYGYCDWYSMYARVF